MLLDVHTHIDSYLGGYSEIALEQIRHLRILSISNSMSFLSYAKNKEIAKKCPFVIPTFGIHPENAPQFVDRQEEIEMAAQESLFLGEVGLDMHFVKDRSKYEAQRQVFEMFLDCAKKYDKLVIVHTKGAEDEVLKMLQHYKIQRAIIHWYSGPIDTYFKMVREGYRFSIGFMVMHSDFIRIIAKRIPREQLLIETDNPGGFEWKNGRPGMPLLVRDISKEIARLRNQSQEEQEHEVWENFMNMLTPDERKQVLNLTKEIRS
jgi:TatD DNase family protein